MKKGILTSLGLAAVLTLGLATVNEVRGTEVDAAGTVDELQDLFEKYYNNGIYTKDTVINLKDAAKQEVVALFHGSVNNLERTTYYNGGELWMTNDAGTINSGYGTNGNTMTHFTIDLDDGSQSVDYSVPNTTMEDYYATLKDFVLGTHNSVHSNGETLDLTAGWSKTEKGYTSSNADVIDAFRLFTAPLWIGKTSETENYINYSHVTVEEENAKLVMKLYAEEGNSGLLSSNDLVFSQATISNDYLYNFKETDKTVFDTKKNGSYMLAQKGWNFETDTTYFGWDSQYGKGLQIGSGNVPAKSITLSTQKEVSVKSVKINTSGASSIVAKLTVKVGDEVLGEPITLTKDATDYVLESETELKGQLTLSYSNTSSKAIYINSIALNPVQYTITLPEYEEGTISGDTSAYDGATKTYTLTPAEGYQVGEVTVNGEAVTVTDNKFSVIVTENISISVTWDVYVAPTEKEYSHTFASNQLKTTAGSVELSNNSWTQSSSTYIGWDASKGIQIGSKNNPQKTFTLSTNDFSSYKITKIVINASMGSSGNAKLSISVGGNTVLSSQALTTSAKDYTATVNDLSGEITISFSCTARAYYIKSITIYYK